jgi:soluble lytic murein transglycosylase-like protein
MKRRRLIAACAVAAAACLMPAAGAAELITLRNGFQMQCDHHVTRGGTVRIYLTAGNDNYIELPPSDIAAVSPLSDPVTAPQPSAASAGPQAASPSAALGPAQQNPGPPAALSRADLHEMLAKAGRSHNLDVDLLASVVHAESDGNPRAVSRAGARGLMQLMPSTAATLGVQNSFQPEQNVSGGSAYLDALLKYYGNNLALALAAYNAGPEAVDRYHGIPPYPETRAYVARVIHEFNRRVRAREAAQHHASDTYALPHKLHAGVSQK